MKQIVLLVLSLLTPTIVLGQEFHWKDAPKAVQKVGKRLTAGKPKKDTFKGLRNVTGTISGEGFLGDLFGGGGRDSVRIERKFDNTSQIDIHYIENIRKVYWEKDTDDKNDGGRVRILVIAPGKKAEGEEGEQGFPRVVANWEFGHGERLTDKKKYGNVVVIIYPTKVKKGEENTVYYHLEWNS